MSSTAGAPSRSLVAAGFAVVYLVWGSTYLAIRVAIETLPPFLMAGTRFLIAGLLMYGFARLRGAGPGNWREWRSAALLGALFLLFGNGGVVWAEQRVPSGLAAVLVAPLPIWTAIIEWVRPGGRRPGLATTIGLVAGFAGVAVLVAPGRDGNAAVDHVGAAVLIMASLSWAIASVASRGLPQPNSGALASGMQMLAGGVWLSLAALATGEVHAVEPDSITLRSAGALLYLITFGSLLGFGVFTWLLRVSTPARVATYAYVNPIVAVLLGWALAGEPFGPRELAAAAIVVGGVALITTAKAVGGRR